MFYKTKSQEFNGMYLIAKYFKQLLSIQKKNAK
jgi:hypothetical protein